MYPALQAVDTQYATASLEIGDEVPAGQARQVDAAVAAVEPEYVPAPHGVHAALPVTFEYLPA